MIVYNNTFKFLVIMRAWCSPHSPSKKNQCADSCVDPDLAFSLVLCSEVLGLVSGMGRVHSMGDSGSELFS